MSESLREKQSRFVLMISHLILFAHSLGYELTFGYAERCKDCPVGHSNSNHKRRLAIDFNLFKDGKWLNRTEDFLPLGEYWESIGGTWGGRFYDGNHFSLEHNGIK